MCAGQVMLAPSFRGSWMVGSKNGLRVHDFGFVGFRVQGVGLWLTA